MSLAVVYSRAQLGIEAPLVSVEVHLSNGLPSLSIVGLPETAVKESKDRVRGALLNSRFEFPTRRITVNLAPADLPKAGGRFDLPIALGILAASGQIPKQALSGHEFIGELALSGELRAVRGVLCAALQCGHQQRTLILPKENATEAALVQQTVVLGANHLLEVTEQLTSGLRLTPELPAPPPGSSDAVPDLADVRGQHQARRALEVAAAGGHSLLMVGPPGTGKSLLACRLPGILPPLTDEQALETAAVTSVSPQGFDYRTWKKRPFRNPHHTSSAVALVGGGSHPRPGEISLAHHGVLFLDELPEFDRRALEVLREPLETGCITISRAARQAEFPARFQLIAAMNPCHCGYLGDPSGRCRCTAEQVQRYRAKISGPLLDRIDIQIEVPRLPFEQLQGASGESSEVVRKRVEASQQRQRKRSEKLNALLDNKEIDKFCTITEKDKRLLHQVMERFQLSARAYHRILKVARTIADLEGVKKITTKHLTESIGYRCLDRNNP
ncbi:MAG: YifB family Mg chelatase-like AAA ATPase [Gammaproteobacteria bacterium]